MIYEERDYRIRPGKLAQFVTAYEQHGLPIQRRHLGKLIAYFTSEIGELNHVVAIWGYDSLDDRQRRRGAMLADPEWRAYTEKVNDLIDIQNTRILTPSTFSPLQ